MAAGVQASMAAREPGGALAITTWGPRFFEPLNSAFWDAVREEHPDLYKAFNPWDAITEPRSARGSARARRRPNASIEPESAAHPLSSPGVVVGLRPGLGLSRDARTVERGVQGASAPAQPGLHPVARRHGSRVERGVCGSDGRKLSRSGFSGTFGSSSRLTGILIFLKKKKKKKKFIAHFGFRAKPARRTVPNLRQPAVTKRQRRVRVQIRAARNQQAANLPQSGGAIIAALSVDRCGLGNEHGQFRASAARLASARSRLLAETPPAMPSLRALCHFAAANVRSTSVSTTIV